MAKTAAKTSDAKSDAKTASKTSSAKAPAKSASAKPAKAKSGGAKSGDAKSARTDGIHAKVQPSKELGAVVGAGPLPRSEVVSKIWDYIKKNKLQDPKDGRNIVADDKLGVIFGKKTVTMFELNKIISGHLTK